MAPPPEYDKEPKAPDKSATNISCEETKALHNLVNDQQTNSDNKSSSTAASAEVENNKLVETLDDGQLRALLDEAITYKCPKDREGKSSLFKELLEEVEQDEQASEAAARSLGGGRAAVTRASVAAVGRGARSRRALPHSNSLQDLVAALAAEPAPRRHHRAPPAPAPAPVSARAIHGGSLPSGVDTSFLLGEEPARGSGYLATVRCVNPPPLAERRVSTDANCSSELDSLNRRSKPAFPMTYTARATLEIGSGAVCSGRAITTTTASNQVRTPPACFARFRPPPTAGPPERLYSQNRLYIPYKYQKKRFLKKNWSETLRTEMYGSEADLPEVTNDCDTELNINKETNNCEEVLKEIIISNTDITEIIEEEETNTELSIGTDDDTEPDNIVEDNIDPKQFKLLSALFPKMSCDKAKYNGGGSKISTKECDTTNTDKENVPRGPQHNISAKCQKDADINSTKFLKEAKEDVTRSDIETNISSKGKKEEFSIDATSSHTETNISTKKEKEPKTSLARVVTNRAKKQKKKVSASNTGAKLSKNKDNKTDLNRATKTTISKAKQKKTVSPPTVVTSAKEPSPSTSTSSLKKTKLTSNSNVWTENVNNWYVGLENYSLDGYYHDEQNPSYQAFKNDVTKDSKEFVNSFDTARKHDQITQRGGKSNLSCYSANVSYYNVYSGSSELYNNPYTGALKYPLKSPFMNKNMKKRVYSGNDDYAKYRGIETDAPIMNTREHRVEENARWVLNDLDALSDTCNYRDDYYDYDDLCRSRREYRERVGKYLVTPKMDDINPRNIRSMTIGKPSSDFEEFTKSEVKDDADDNLQMNNEHKEDKSLKEINFPTHIDKHQDLLPSSNNTKAMEENLKDINKHLDWLASSNNTKAIDEDLKDIDKHQDLLASSNNTKAMEEDLKDIADVSLDLSIRSSTPIPGQASLEIESSSVFITEKGIEVTSPESSSKKEDSSVAADTKRKKGTVIPLVNLPCSVYIDNNEHLCSFSQEKVPSTETELVGLPSQQDKDKHNEFIGVNPITNNINYAKNPSSENEPWEYVKFINVNPKANKDTISYENAQASEIELVDICHQQDNVKHKELNINVNLKTYHNNTINNENDVELIDMSSRSQEIKNKFQDSVEDSTKLAEFLDDHEVIISKYFAERQKKRKCDDTYDNYVELADMSSCSHGTNSLHKENTMAGDSTNKHDDTSFLKYVAEQQKLFQVLEDSTVVDSIQKHSLVSKVSSLSSEKVHASVKDNFSECISEYKEESEESHEITVAANVFELAAKFDVVFLMKNPQDKAILSLPKNLVSNYCSISKPIRHAIEYSKAIDSEDGQSKEKRNHRFTDLLNQDNTVIQQNYTGSKRLNIENPRLNKKKDLNLEKTKLETASKKALKAIMFENHSKSRKGKTSSISIKEVDSAIPFSCITTPEVVASCNTTSSTSQSTVAVDPKPLQLASSYRAVASLVGAAPARASPPPSPPPRADQVPLQNERPLPHCAPAPAPATNTHDHPRSVISSSFNGLPLSRPNYGSTGNTTQDEYKKSIDENGNSVQGFSSPLSGSSQHKKPRRKKSSKNETVIKSHQIDGYQGNKDLNEVLRFIESAADTSRAGKLGRAKHRDDADDKGGKKRSGARKDKESKMKRATSMEELSCSRMEDLTDKPSPPARAPRHSDQAKAERRSWGDDARDAATRFFREEPIDVPVVPDTEFQTVTKKRKPRRRADDPPDPPEPAAGDPPRATRPPEPRARRVSAPPSDRSNDSNDDMDSVHSLPADAAAGSRAAAPAPAPAPISYADIARTRHNIPDLIESCNYYSEGERERERDRERERERERGERDRGLPVSEAALPLATATTVTTVATAATDADGYPALEPRARRALPPAAHAKPTHLPQPRRDRKVERTESVRSNCSTVAGRAVAEWPAPDVVADRRPAVILLDSAAHPRDMDGVTFGFDINETLLGGPSRRPRCDLIRDALEGAIPVAETNGVGPGVSVAEGVGVADGVGAGVGVGVAVLAGCAALRYVPPAAPASPADTLHLHQIIDYVGAAWEDVMRGGAGKVRYYSE